MMDWNEEPWLVKRQEAYDRLMASFEGLDRSSTEMFDAHNAVMKELDMLPYADGGRQL